jgi:hypothetical protein
MAANGGSTSFLTEVQRQALDAALAQKAAGAYSGANR